MPIMITLPIVLNVHGGFCLFGSICGLKAAVKTSTNGASVHSLLWAAGYLAAAFCMLANPKFKRILDLARMIFGALFLAIVFALIGSIFFPVGTVIGFAIGIGLGIKGIQEWDDPEKNKAFRGKCPHCNSSIRWTRLTRGFNCPTCKERIVLVADQPLTPAQAKEIQSI